MQSLLIVVKEDFLAKGIALALMDDFQSIHTTKNSYDAFKILERENIDVVITEIIFDTIESNVYLKKIINLSKRGSSVIVLNDASLSLPQFNKQINIIIQQKPISIKRIKKIIESVSERKI